MFVKLACSIAKHISQKAKFLQILLLEEITLPSQTNTVSFRFRSASQAQIRTWCLLIRVSPRID